MVIEFVGRDKDLAEKVTATWFQEEGLNFLLEMFYRYGIKVDMLKITNKIEIYLREI